ncbi:P-loop containing nucleoside triphosphate hydrolase protein [Auriculariales sp. MPI-PUGE-AT-0066]|nr:P-loop containing nucleoside triphosphate hydrolase protein [Auriculariales sp. MPI-PUGE-AT-0066]
MPRKRPASAKQKKADLQLARAVKRGDEPAPPKLKPGQTRASVQQAEAQRANRVQSRSGPSSAAADSSRKLESAFIKLDVEFLERTKIRASEDPLSRPIPSSILTVPDEIWNTDDDPLSCPRRPKWNYENTKKEVEKNEEALFDTWKQNTDNTLLEWARSGDWGPSYYERNLEVWRQFWRVSEISEIMLILLDSRLPPLHFPPSLQAFLNPRKGPTRKVILVLTKADVSGPRICDAWKQWLSTRYANVRIATVESYREKPRPSDQGKGRPRYEPHIPPESLRELIDALKAAHKELVTPPPAVQQDPVKLAAWKPRVKSDVDWEKVMQPQDQRSLPKPSNIDDENDDEEKPFFTLGLVGQPNVGKSSLLNALFGAHKVKASRTPGKTKHFQTLFWTPEIRLVDCPGLVMPNYAHLELQVLCGILPIARIPSLPSCIHYAARLMPLERILGLKHPSLDASDPETLAAADAQSKRTWRDGQRERLDQEAADQPPQWTAMDIMVAFAYKNGWKTAKAGRSDFQRAGNASECSSLRVPIYSLNLDSVMRALAEARIKWAFRPPTEGAADETVASATSDGIWLSEETSHEWIGEDQGDSEDEHGSEDENPNDESGDDNDYNEPVGIVKPGTTGGRAGFFNLLAEEDDEAGTDEEDGGQRSDQYADEDKGT